MLRSRLKISRLKISLPLLITIPFVLQAWGIVGLVGYFSYRSGEKSVQDRGDRLAIGFNENVETHQSHRQNPILLYGLAFGLALVSSIGFGRWTANRIKRSLHPSELLLQEIYKCSPVHIYIFVRRVDGSCYCEHLSQTIENILEVSIEEVKKDAQILLDIIHPADRPGYDAAEQQSRETLQPFHHEWRIINPSGRVKWLQGDSSPVFRENGDIAWHGVVQEISDRKELELNLKTSEAKLQSILNSVSAIITHLWVYPNHRWEIDYVSAGSEQISGYTQTELQDPDLWLSRILPEDWQGIEAQVFEDVFAQRSGTYEYRFRCKNDRICWISQTNYSSWDEEKQAWSVTIVTMDICDRKKAEEKLQASQANLAEAQRIAHIGNWSFDLQTQKIHWSEELFRMFKLDPKQPTPSYAEYLAMIAPSDRLHLQEKINLAIMEGTPYLVDYKAVLPDGSIRFHEGRGEVERDDQGHVIRLRGTGLDITDRKVVELELIKRTEELDRFFSVALDLLCIANPEGYFLRLNPQWERTLGYPLSDLEGSRFLDYVHPDDHVSTEDALQCLTQKKILPNFVNRYRSYTGTYHWIEWRSVMVGDLIYAAARDITERKEAQEQLEKARDRAEALTHAKSEFLANMSHEIRTPLSSIIAIAELLEYSKLSVEQQDLVKTLCYSSETLLQILNNILDFSKIEAKGLVLEKNPLSIATEVAAIVKLFEKSAQDKDIILKSSLHLDSSTTFLGDVVRLRQILLNLISNALKFTESGSIEVVVQERSHQITHENDRYELLFSIQDTGIGIQPDQLEKLFHPFSQGDTSISRKYGGTGLGLVISQRLVELMGGSLWVESFGRVAGSPPADWQPSIHSVHLSGSTFYFTIGLESDRSTPVVDCNRIDRSSIDRNHIDRNGGDAQSRNNPSADNHNISNHRADRNGQNNHKNHQFAQDNPLVILLVDDNPINRKVVHFSFKKLGYIIDTASNGREALEAVQQKGYDLILMDIQMPEMDGLTTTKLIREANIKQPCIIALTSNVLPEDRQACFDAGMNGYETKPLRIETIEQICQDLAHSTALT